MERCSKGFPGGASDVIGVEDDESEAFSKHFEDILNGNFGAESVSGDEVTLNLGHLESAVGSVNGDIQQNSFAGFDFQNMLRHSSLQRITALPDFPWETTEWKALFDDSHDPPAVLNPSRLLSDPVLPTLTGGADEMVDRLVAEKKRVAPLVSTSPFYTIAVGHRLDSSWEEKREADTQRSLMKWSGIVLLWPPEISSFISKSAETMQPTEVCEQLGHYFAGKAPVTLIKRANSMIFVMEFAFKLGYMFPYPESELYSLLKTLKSAGYTCSRMKGVMEALTFCRFVFGIEELHKISYEQTLSWSHSCRAHGKGQPG